nr:MAG TPA: hypothetical protein [Caudoviricetes sp.]
MFFIFIQVREMIQYSLKAGGYILSAFYVW